MTVSPPQLRAIFAAGRRRGLGLDDLRDLTPNGSVSKLTRTEAAALLERLNRGTQFEGGRRPRRRRRRPKEIYAPVSGDQLAKIEALRIDLRWTAEGLRKHLAARRYPADRSRCMDDIVSASDGVAVIEHLKIVLDRVKYYAAKRRQRNAAPGCPA